LGGVQVETDDRETVRAAVSDGLTVYNDGFLPRQREREALVLSARDDDGRIVGGLVGEFRMDWLYVDLLWVDPSQRGKGYGEKLMALAEDSARAAGKTHVHLWTWSFQAPDFYRRLGYVEFGRLIDHPKGHDTFMFSKTL
jgi:GNAT superfamily N-acetyltransferase